MISTVQFPLQGAGVLLLACESDGGLTRGGPAHPGPQTSLGEVDGRQLRSVPRGHLLQSALACRAEVVSLAFAERRQVEQAVDLLDGRVGGSDHLGDAK